MPIRKLDLDVVQKIAAGEIVERPASAVKELIENSLDAGATQVQIEVRTGGLGLIRIVDDGRGIPASEAELAFAPHATSKLRHVDDLAEIQTLGFRGEALASIAAVSHVVCHTRAEGEEMGVVLTLEEGNVVDRKPWAGPVGTSIVVRNLLFNVPARLKFLRSSASEAGHIGHLVEQFAMGHPEVRFRFVNDSRRVIETPGSGNIRDAVRQVYGPEIADAMVALEDVVDSLQLRVFGLLSPPDQTRATRSGLSFFVNGRRINHLALGYAIEEAYQPALPAGRHPIVVLHLALPPSSVDCNVHPTKVEVRLASERAILGAVHKAVRQALLEVAPLPEVGVSLEPAVWPVPSDWFEAALAPPPPPVAPSVFPSPPTSSASPLATPPRTPDVLSQAPSTVPPREGSAMTSETDPQPAFRSTALRAIGQIQNTYIIAEGPGGVYFVDQHTAHERILYEEIFTRRTSGHFSSQALLTPVVVQLSARQWSVVTEQSDALRGLGFDIEEFGPDSFAVRGVPPTLIKGDIARALRDAADALTGDAETPEGSDRLVATLACHSAVRAGDPLTPEEINRLLVRLETTDVSRYCPHGRPVVIHLSTAQLERDFHRR